MSNPKRLAPRRVATRLSPMPELLLLDEPTSQLDVEGAARYEDLLRGLRDEEDVTMVMVGHDLDSMSRLADHITGLGKLREQTGGVTAMCEMTQAECLSTHFADGERLKLDGVDIQAIYTPGHTDDSYSFLLPDRVLTGDTLLIRGTGRTDFQNGDAGEK